MMPSRVARVARAVLPVALVLSALLATPAMAQIRASELASVSQVIDGTRFQIDYSRPRLRGRDSVFGTRAVQWGETWTPGANWATTLEVNKDAKLNGHAVPKGKYSVWIVVRKAGDWTMVLDPRAHLFHEDHPDSSDKQLRFAVHPEPAPKTEVLTWSFPELSVAGGMLAMQWATTRVPIKLEIEPTLGVLTPAAEAARLVGSYAMSRRDSTSNDHITGMVVTYENGTLRGEFIPAHPYFRKFALVRIGAGMFAPGIYNKQGELYEVLRPDLTFTFDRAGTRAASLEARDDSDTLWYSGIRTP
jgi:hypothetical protein